MSNSYEPVDKTPQISKESLLRDKLNNGTLLRVDDRETQELRRLYVKFGVVTQASGSAYLEYGNTKLIASVHGPRASLWRTDFSETATVKCDFKYAPFSTPSIRGKGQQQDEKELSQLIEGAIKPMICIEKYPKSNIEIYIYILESDGSEISAAISCASLALIDTGMELYDIIGSCTVGVLNNQFIIDPSNIEILNCDATITIGYMKSMNQITYYSQEGTLSSGESENGMILCLDGCKSVCNLLRQSIIEYTLQKINKQ